MTQQHDDRDPLTSNADTNSITAEAAGSAAAAQGANLPESGVRPKAGAAPVADIDYVRERDFEKIQLGWGVFSSDGDQLGTVDEIGNMWLLLHYGEEREHPMYVPEEYIETVAGTRVVLNQPGGLLKDMKLDAPPLAVATAQERRGGRDHDPRPGEPGWTAAAEDAAGAPLGLRSNAEMSPTPNPPRPRATPPATASPAAPPSAQIAAEADRAATNTTSADDAPSRAQNRAARPVQPSDPRVIGDRPGAEMVFVSQGTADRMYVDERIEQRGDGLHQVEATVDPRQVTGNVRRGQPEPARNNSTTHMAPAPGESLAAPSMQVNATDNFYQQTEERTGLPTLSASGSYDEVDGPTHQPGVMPGREHLPNRTPISETGVPGDGKERALTDTNLYTNQHPDGDAFGSQSSTVGRPLRPGQPSTAHRAVEDARGFAAMPPTSPGEIALDAPPEPPKR